MRQPDEYTPNDEPVGIVISRGSREEAIPRFAAYVWSDSDEYAEPVEVPRSAA
ncbi:MAG TPA: hypothetical protein VKZ41_11865 [Gemmatimonadales bacterium]|nr:hypothetical protein [Gemmatimonadales bacterium]